MSLIFQKDKSFCCRFSCKGTVSDLTLCYLVGCCSAECSSFYFHLLLTSQFPALLYLVSVTISMFCDTDF